MFFDYDVIDAYYGYDSNGNINCTDVLPEGAILLTEEKTNNQYYLI